ncbi:NADP-dependent oxidoreductase [Caulobacter endophyticus]|uniref:Enoyl reductase (ER) domain-containing protein n=1 Tax=Caulobacter endophyticus TaxID=2172652 RepID=A0A2T9KA19_9CAUL|nr:NADP-dependent oxidoreductase [Caulobacter endophyticus]PVM92719.1 hypothetical protein DDF67_04945 [Caulobacter endophyticus]
MKAIEYSDYQGADSFGVVNVSRPTPAEGQVLVKVMAAGVNPFDLKVASGVVRDLLPIQFPFRPGGEFSGVVAELGPDVQGFAVGDAVHAVNGMGGAFAEYIAIDADKLVAKPSALSFVEAAALPVAASTATAVLDAVAVKTGDRILVHAAAGGVGSILVQLAVNRGAEVIALASSANTDFVRALGAHQVIDRTSAYENAVAGVDAVIDLFGPDAQARSWGLVKAGGIVVSIVAPPDQAEAEKYGVRAILVRAAPAADALAKANALVADGKLKVHVGRTYPLSEARDAYRMLATQKVRGKLVLTMG